MVRKRGEIPNHFPHNRRKTDAGEESEQQTEQQEKSGKERQPPPHTLILPSVTVIKVKIVEID